MFLKSLDIFGFKSFPDKVHIDFSEGITALVGPNGCGKSNVVDAVKWVLGEQSAKTLRADKMEDIIFNGTENRKPLNVAEVTLTIRNENGFLSLDVSEIAIKRRVYRSGESEYFINNRPVKLREIRELFWDTGVGKVAYSVMEQGKIDQVLSSKPEDRRYLFEEAAGITRFKAKRQEAERKLERTEENVKRISSILNEVKRSYDSLKVQAEKTEKYKKLSDSIFEAELDVQLLKLRENNSRLDEKQNDVVETKKRVAELTEKLDAITASISENAGLVNDMQIQFSEIQKNIFSIAAEQNTKKENVKIYERRQLEVKNKIAQLEGRKRSITEKIEALNDDIDEKQADLHALEKNISDIDKNINDFKETINIAFHRITTNTNAISEKEQKILLLEQQRTEKESELHDITENIVTELDKKLNQTGFSSKERSNCETQLFNYVEKLKVLAAARKQLLKDMSILNSDPAQVTEKLNTTFDEIEKLLDDLHTTLISYRDMSFRFIDEFLAPEGIITKKRAIDKTISNNKAEVENIRAQIVQLRTDNEDLDTKIAQYNETLSKLSVNKAKADTQSLSCKEQISILKRELASQENSQREIENDIFAENKNYGEIEQTIIDLQGEINEFERKGQKLTDELKKLESAISLRNSDLSSKKDKIASLNEQIAKYQAQLEKHFTAIDFIKEEISDIKMTFRENYSVDLMEHEERMFKITKQAAELKAKALQLKQEIKSLGTVNHLAIEEFNEVKERYDFFTTQINDLQKAREDLKRVTDEIRAESTEIFLETYQKIKKNFHNMFRRLFGGGKAEIRLDDPKHVLESGIEIFAQPPGKRLESIGLLSGGEKSMTAVALLFATYMVKPSPFCFLDEIDAALDEQNVTRFSLALKEFANVSQYIIITHNKKTVVGAHSMLGVTMQESGVSTIISYKFDIDSKRIKEEMLAKTEEIEKLEDEEVPEETGIYVPPHPPKRIQKDAIAAETTTQEGNTLKNET
ncbi:MAG: AAA family ATPase [Spirochaetaceae bacterium]|nr:AAA family ATPase [Spirochaetaceae bacterium]